MRNAKQIPWIMTVILAFCGAAICAESDAETEALIKKLSSDDFDEREAAAVELGKRAEKIWQRLEELSKGEQADVRTLARRAMCEAGKRALVPFVETMEKKVAASEQSMKDMEAELTRAKKAVQDAFAAEQKAIEKRIIDSSTENKEIEEAALEATINARTRCAKAEDAYRNKLGTWRLSNAALQSRLLQLRQLVNSGEPILPADIPTWTPAKLPFEQRLACKVTFEFVDMPLTDALAWMGDVCGAKFEASEKVVAAGAPSINLRVTDMNASLATEWIARLCDLDLTIDRDKQRVLLHEVVKK